jgi:hypothetical protein
MIPAPVRIFYRASIDTLVRAASHRGGRDLKHVSQSLAIKNRKCHSNEAALLRLLTPRADMQPDVKGYTSGRKSSPVQYFLGRFCSESPIVLLLLSGHIFRGRKLPRSRQGAGVAEPINPEGVFKN